jgi:phosphate transport system protein
MSELAKKLERVFLKLDRSALAAEQQLSDMIFAVNSGKRSDAEAVIAGDEEIDRCEVEIESDCVRLLALYQPAASDLRKICFVIKANNDLERLADNCVSAAKMQLILINDDVSASEFPLFKTLADSVAKALHQTIQLISSNQSTSQALSIIRNDRLVVDKHFRDYLESVFASGERFQGQPDSLYALTSIGRALEKVGDICANIAEDTVFLLTGEIVRHHPELFTQPPNS